MKEVAESAFTHSVNALVLDAAKFTMSGHRMHSWYVAVTGLRSEKKTDDDQRHS